MCAQKEPPPPPLKPPQRTGLGLASERRGWLHFGLVDRALCRLFLRPALDRPLFHGSATIHQRRR